MMNALSRHPKRQGVTYFEHLAFAMGVSWRLLGSVVVFALHALLPVVPIEQRLDLEATSAFLLERNHFIETAAASAHGRVSRGRAQSRPGRQDTPALA